mgnify:FL=1|jgi:N-acetylneuraminate synthase/N,N'-diacetyllegionaminate synthase|tara:strand:+ start:139 stop:1155 length:1017 start_codon:yes stop_codon:yes gene_type:complete
MKKNIWSGKNGPLLIAEIGGNHEGNFNYAKKLLRLADFSNVDVIKYQIYQGSTLINKILSPQRYKHFKKLELSKKQHLYLADQCKERGLKYLSSVWNGKDLKWIAGKMDFFKIGSGDLTAYDQINELCKYKKPILISTGLSNLKEIKETIKFIKSRNSFYKQKKNISIMQCTSCYPTNSDEINLNVIKSLKKLGYTTGYSHHHLSAYPLEIAYILGAQVLEFHFTDTKKNKIFRDHKISLTPELVKILINKIKNINQLLGSFGKKPTIGEIKSNHIKLFRRGMYLNKNIKKNSTVREKDLICLRPEEGLGSKNYFNIINKRAKKDLKKFEPLKIQYFK